MQNLFRNRNNRYNKKLSSYNMYNNILEFILVVLPTRLHPLPMRFFFIFIFFNFVFYKNLFLFLKFTRIYPGRPAAGRQGLFCKKIRGKFARRSLKDQSPGSRAAGPAAQAGHPDAHQAAASSCVRLKANSGAPLSASSTCGWLIYCSISFMQQWTIFDLALFIYCLLALSGRLRNGLVFQIMKLSPYIYNLLSVEWKFARRLLEDRSPGSGAAVPQAYNPEKIQEKFASPKIQEKSRKKFLVCRNTIHTTYNGLTVH